MRMLKEIGRLIVDVRKATRVEIVVAFEIVVIFEQQIKPK